MCERGGDVELGKVPWVASKLFAYLSFQLLEEGLEIGLCLSVCGYGNLALVSSLDRVRLAVELMRPLPEEELKCLEDQLGLAVCTAV